MLRIKEQMEEKINLMEMEYGQEKVKREEEWLKEREQI
jgi:hypothetical protein